MIIEEMLIEVSEPNSSDSVKITHIKKDQSPESGKSDNFFNSRLLKNYSSVTLNEEKRFFSNKIEIFRFTQYDNY